MDVWRVTSILALAHAACDGCYRDEEPPISAPSAPAQTSVTLPIKHAPPHAFAPNVIGRSPHDPAAFTQGLIFSDGMLLESTGLYGQSTLRRVDPASGRPITQVQLPADVFGEGLARLGGELFQLSWREHRCFVYDAASLEKRRELSYEGEGWGLASDGAVLIMSDGSARLRFLEPSSFREVRSVTVHDEGRPLTELNELEWFRGEVLANVWQTAMIARIDPESGQVRGYMDLSALPEPKHEDPDAVLNGIAYDDSGGRLFVTGKRWGSVFEVTVP